ncbi:MAG: lipopolysaccharide kinase InaA family protein [Planctomycetaceae bacterium]
MFASETIRELLARNGLTDLDAVFRRGRGSHCRHEGRLVYRMLLERDNGEPWPVFVKLNWGRRRLWPRMTDLKTGQLFQSLPEREWHGLATLERLGLNVPRRLALFRDGWLNFRAAVVLETVPPRMSLDEMLGTSHWRDLTDRQQTRLLEAVVAVTRRIHNAGLAWRGTSSRHYYPLLQPDGSWKLWLIDCEGVHPLYSRGLIARDWDKLIRAMIESGADERTITTLRRSIDPPSRRAA